MKMKIKKIYRFPIKSFTEEKRSDVNINDSGRIIGDRIAAFKLGDSQTNNYSWLPKKNYLSLMHLPFLAKVNISLNNHTDEINIKLPDKRKINLKIFDTKKLEEIISEFLAENNFHKKISFLYPNHPDISFHDTKDGGISLHSLSSEKEINSNFRDIEGIRFRSNLVINSLEPFEELNWVGKRISISNMIFEVSKTISRCSTINCNPKKGIYDKNILKILPKLNGVSKPSFGIKLKLISEGGTIKIDDEIKVLE